MNQEDNLLFCEDCKITQQRQIEYGYVITSPPDFEEIGYDPLQIINYQEFLIERLANLNPKSGYLTIFISDRKYKSGIISKHQIIRELLEDLDYKLVSQKIWVKSFKKNLYRMNYTFILTFRNKNATKPNPILSDVFYQEHKNIGKYSYNFSKEIVSQFIEAYTNENETVYDPFIGSGQTALACIDTKRHYIGSEIDPEVFDLCVETISNYEAIWTRQNTIDG